MNKTTSFSIFAENAEPGSCENQGATPTDENRVLATSRFPSRTSISQLRTFRYPLLERAVFLTFPKKSFLDEMAKWTGGARFSIHCQKGHDLGERLADAVELEFSQGFRKVVIVGTDSPLIGPREFHSALEALDNHEVVPGPVEDVRILPHWVLVP